jgi:large subunit ribosomal protein L24
MMKIRKNDTVMVIAGRDKGKSGKVRYAYPRKGRVLVEGVNFVKKHARATGQARQAGIIEREMALDISNVMLVCTRCSKPTRVGHRYLEDGRKVRVCRACGEVID